MTMEPSAVVRLYDEGDWFSEGRVTKIEDGRVTVDFADWMEEFDGSDLQLSYMLFQEVWVVVRRGTITVDFRH